MDGGGPSGRPRRFLDLVAGRIYPTGYTEGVNPAIAVRRARQAADLTQAELAERSGTSQATISAYEHGTKTPTPATLGRVLAAAGRRLTTAPASRPVRAPPAGELEQRGGVLAQVVALAGRLPARRAAALRYPRLSQTRS